MLLAVCCPTSTACSYPRAPRPRRSLLRHKLLDVDTFSSVHLVFIEHHLLHFIYYHITVWHHHRCCIVSSTPILAMQALHVKHCKAQTRPEAHWVRDSIASLMTFVLSIRSAARNFLQDNCKVNMQNTACWPTVHHQHLHCRNY